MANKDNKNKPVGYKIEMGSDVPTPGTVTLNFKKLKVRINKAEADEWTKKLEEIKAMNIPFGAPITLSDFFHPRRTQLSNAFY